jgi:hypothetical protein
MDNDNRPASGIPNIVYSPDNIPTIRFEILKSQALDQTNSGSKSGSKSSKKIPSATPAEIRLKSSNQKEKYHDVSLSFTKGYNSRVMAGTRRILLKVSNRSAIGLRGHSNGVRDEMSLRIQTIVPTVVTIIKGMMKFL